MSASARVLAAAEALVAALKAEGGSANAAVRSGNRTTPTTSYRGGNVEQDVMDVARRAIRLSKAGVTLNKKERNVARRVLKAFKASHSVLNTNGQDVFTLAGL